MLVSSTDQLQSLVHVQQQQQTEDHKTKTNIRDEYNEALPTFYYKIIIYRGHHRNTIYRSTTQFLSLYQQLQTIDQKIPKQQQSISIPHPIHGSSRDNCCLTVPIFQQIQEIFQYYTWRYQLLITNGDVDVTYPNTSIVPFADTRMQHLKQFLLYILEESGPTYSNHSSEQTFLDI
jgi:hypothetical protein